MKKIKIKRSTKDGLKDAEGILLEAHGYQFCLTKSEENLWFIIELSSGGNVRTMDADDYSKKQALKEARYEFDKRSTIDFKIGINQFIKDTERRYKFSFPINEPILND